MRTKFQKTKDFVTFPLRALTLFTKDAWGLSSLRTERFDYVAREVRGYCLDVGCGEYNLFIESVLKGNGRGVDVYGYKGLSKDQIISDLAHLPFENETFDSATFIANINHIPEGNRVAELKEAFRCLKPGGNIIVTMGNPVAEVAVHKVVALHDRIFHTSHDMDGERGMHHDESYYLRNREICRLLTEAGFSDICVKYFVTQWGLNHLFVAWKVAA